METTTVSSSRPVKLSLPLAFQQEIFQQVRSEDQLVILARGLGLLRIVTNLLHSYDAAGGNLVILLGASEKEMSWIGDALLDQAVVSKSPTARGLRTVKTDTMSIAARKKEYAKGGILAITSRIMIVDLLRNYLKPETITGVVVIHAERVIATSLEAFILRVYRQRNKEGFLKAFSDTPEPFTSGLSPLATMMRNLHLRTPSLWPRFHVTVTDSLESKNSDVVELNVTMTDAMREIQASILRCMEACLGDIKKGNSKDLDIEDWNVESALHQSFDIIIRRHLDPVWHRVSLKTKQLVGDLKQLRQMLNYLVAYDSVNFLKHIETIRLEQSITNSGSTRQNQSPWLFLDAGTTIFTVAKNRAYRGTERAGNSSDGRDIPLGVEPVLEEQPKWEMLSDVLDEIERDVHFNQLADDSHGTVLIMCSDEDDNKISGQLREYLETVDKTGSKSGKTAEEGIEVGTSASYMMRRSLKSYLAWKKDAPRRKAQLMSQSSNQMSNLGDTRPAQSLRGNAPSYKRRRTRGGSSASAGTIRETLPGMRLSEEDPELVALLNDQLSFNEDRTKYKDEVLIDTFTNPGDFYQLYEFRDLVVVHPFSGDLDDRLLEELRPRYIIMYTPDTAFVRRIEVYRNSHRDRKVKVYFLYYGDSVEEQRFLSAVRREKDCFTKLVKEKGSMAVTLTTAANAQNPQEEFLRTINTRVAGGGKLAKITEPARVIVDTREFRGSLASLLHGRNLTVIPCMLTVSDYVLTPDICVERKSISDLIESLASGRLYNQCEAMLQYYKQPMVLIEFDMNKSFSLESFADLSKSSTQLDLHTKLVMLTIAFPRVKIIWSSSAYETAEIFEELKRAREEPDIEKAAKYGLEEGEDPLNSSNLIPQELLRAIPGVTFSNHRLITARCQNMIDLSLMTHPDLVELLGKEAGGKVYKFFN